MSTEMKSRKPESYYLTRFYGGVLRGVCIQVTFNTTVDGQAVLFSLSRFNELREFFDTFQCPDRGVSFTRDSNGGWALQTDTTRITMTEDVFGALLLDLMWFNRDILAHDDD